MAVSESKYQWDSEPLTDREDREVFFACRKLWVEGKEDEKETVDQAKYDTGSINPIDIFPYLVTRGYATEKERMEVSLAQIRKIKDMRKKYGINELSEIPWQPEWKFKSISNEEIEKQWPLYIQGADKEGRVIVWDKSGNLDLNWLQEKVRDPEALQAFQFYVVKQVENVLRAKIGVSSKMGFRMVKHVAVIDAKNVKVKNLKKLKDLTGAILADVQSMYPDTLLRMYVINAGWLFKAAWKIIKRFVHPETARKVNIVGTNFHEKLSAAGITEYPAWIS